MSPNHDDDGPVDDDDVDMGGTHQLPARAAAIKVEPESLIGTTVANRFVIEALAGLGGMGAVYRAHDTVGGETVALKILMREGLSATGRMLREAQVLAQVRHQNIVSYIDHGMTTDGEPYLAMEWLTGEDLATRIATSGPLSIADTCSLGATVAAALWTANERGIVHRDIKPHNLFLVDGEVARVKILDFGIARPASAMHALTRTGTSVGTPAYMSPEQARGEKQLDARTDIYSLGCTLFECLTGKPPLVASHISELLRQVLYTEPPPVSSLRPDVPPAIDEIIARMLLKDPAARPAHRGVVAVLSA